MAQTEFRKLELANIHVEQTRKQGRLGSEDSQCSMAQARMSIHHEHEPGHQARRPGHTIVCGLVRSRATRSLTGRVALREFDRFQQRRRLLESETDTFARKRID